jgi:4,5-dihydroxyphthalate decarboxylase
MSKPKVKLGVADHDLNRPLIDGQAKAPDLDLEIVWDVEDGERHTMMARHGAFDACEFSFGNYLLLRSQGRPWSGIPAFPNRKFRHSYVFVNTRAGIREPRDLEGKRVGLRGWAATASLWMRGILHRFYDLDMTRVTWLVPPEPVDINPPAGIVLERLSEGADLDGMLVRGELDALIYPDVPPSVQQGAPEVRRLFEDYRAAEQEFYRRTRIFPISHLVVVTNETIERYPQAPLSLLGAFRQSRDACFHRVDEAQILSLSWSVSMLEEQRALMGRNYWPYNVADNRHVIETLVSFAHEQGIIPRPIAVEELFVPEALNAPGA